MVVFQTGWADTFWEHLGRVQSNSRADDGSTREDETVKSYKRKHMYGNTNYRKTSRGTLHMISTEAERYGVNISGTARHRLARLGYFSSDSRGTFIYSGTNNLEMSGAAF